jgi:hypothetical protein
MTMNFILILFNLYVLENIYHNIIPHGFLNITLLEIQYGLHKDVYRHILECRFTHFSPYVVRIEISKWTYI